VYALFSKELRELVKNGKYFYLEILGWGLRETKKRMISSARKILILFSSV
jgi:hypothetical protein